MAGTKITGQQKATDSEALAAKLPASVNGTDRHVESGQIRKGLLPAPAVAGTAGQILQLQDATTGATIWVAKPEGGGGGASNLDELTLPDDFLPDNASGIFFAQYNATDEKWQAIKLPAEVGAVVGDNFGNIKAVKSNDSTNTVYTGDGFADTHFITGLTLYHAPEENNQLAIAVPNSLGDAAFVVVVTDSNPAKKVLDALEMGDILRSNIDNEVRNRYALGTVVLIIKTTFVYRGENATKYTITTRDAVVDAPVTDEGTHYLERMPAASVARQGEQGFQGAFAVKLATAIVSSGEGSLGTPPDAPDGNWEWHESVNALRRKSGAPASDANYGFWQASTTGITPNADGLLWVAQAVWNPATSSTGEWSVFKTTPDHADALVGPPGKDGKDGADGNDGAQGRPGTAGAPGRAGTDGTDGADAELATDSEFATGTDTSVAPNVAQVAGALAKKIDKPATAGTTGQILSKASDGTNSWINAPTGGGSGAGLTYTLNLDRTNNMATLLASNGAASKIDLSPYLNTIGPGTITEAQLVSALQTKLDKLDGSVVTGVRVTAGGALVISRAGEANVIFNLTTLPIAAGSVGTDEVANDAITRTKISSALRTELDGKFQNAEPLNENTVYAVGDRFLYNGRILQMRVAGRFGTLFPTWSDETWRSFLFSSSNTAGKVQLITGLGEMLPSDIPNGLVAEPKLSAAVQAKLNSMGNIDLTHTVKVTRKEGTSFGDKDYYVENVAEIVQANEIYIVNPVVADLGDLPNAQAGMLVVKDADGNLTYSEPVNGLMAFVYADRQVDIADTDGNVNSFSENGIVAALIFEGERWVITSTQFMKGNNNIMSGAFATVPGGSNNRATSLNSSVGGGQGNRSQGLSSFVGGGQNNHALTTNSATLGGSQGRAQAQNSVVLGGFNAVSNARYGVILGRQGLIGDPNTLFGIAYGNRNPTSDEISGGENLALVYECDNAGNTIQSGTVEATDLKVRASDGTTKTLKQYIHDNIPVWHTARQPNAPAELGIEIGAGKLEQLLIPLKRELAPDWDFVIELRVRLSHASTVNFSNSHIFEPHQIPLLAAVPANYADPQLNPTADIFSAGNTRRLKLFRLSSSGTQTLGIVADTQNDAKTQWIYGVEYLS